LKNIDSVDNQYFDVFSVTFAWVFCNALLPLFANFVTLDKHHVTLIFGKKTSSMLNLQHHFHGGNDIKLKPKFSYMMTKCYKKRKPPALQARGYNQGMRQATIMI